MAKNKQLLFILLPTWTMAKPMEMNLNFKDQSYFIRQDYITREEYLFDNETASTDECQDEVYAAAFDFALKKQCRVVADIGCGSGFKLLKYFKEYQTIGFEVCQTLPFLKSHYPEREWYLSDFSTIQMNLPKIDLVICADVIEHLLDPDQLLNWINKLKFKYLVLSTPDRELLPRIQESNQCLIGPPKNPHHIREWNFDELEKYLSQYLNVINHFHVKKEWWTQVIIAVAK